MKNISRSKDNTFSIAGIEYRMLSISDSISFKARTKRKSLATLKTLITLAS